MANIPVDGGVLGNNSSSMGAKPGVKQNWNTFPNLSITIKDFFYYGVAMLAVLALASFLPKLAIVLVLILITGVLLTHWQDYVGFFQHP